MGWRETGEMYKPRPIRIHTCDQCGKDIGTPDGYGSHYPYFEITAKNYQPVCEDDGSMSDWSLCSLKCLLLMAQRLASGERVTSGSDDL